jgi:AcrR family transcriptional regulator
MYEMSTSKRGAYHHGDLRGALIALALDTIEREGPEGIALRSLAQRAGVSGMAPYRHFADKASLLEAVARHGFAELRDQLREVEDSDPRKSLVAFGVVYVRFACARPGLFRLMFGGPAPTSSEQLAETPGTVFELLTNSIAQIAPPARREITLLACWSIVHGLASLLVSGRIRQPTPPPAELAENLGKMLMRGISDEASR